MTRLVLASASPRRRELLASLGVAFDVCASTFGEPDQPGVSPRDLAVAHARSKALDVRSSHPEAWILGADTVVALGDEVFGKPRDRAEAQAMLQRFSGRWHTVHTGCHLIGPEDLGSEFVETTLVEFRVLSTEEVADYLAHEGEWSDKAGGYGIQSLAGAFVHRVEGSYSNVVGLPLERLALHLREHGLLGAR